ncbi:WxL domain-containing protein [Enterococcus hulanensis]|uniref:WxL domain-containing protein n=1 Tax=Enterococcus TaxID=1350 RepID=UPI000B5A9CFB|nr:MULTISPECIES: WxL domain-containing protein [Enterococcus]MBO0409590.1 WxL domain-containing protein [Enterococcus hulanensis]OTO21042.1 hypothetical protein A5875_002414 [Enterococcus sp. 3H8_DIV0648]
MKTIVRNLFAVCIVLSGIIIGSVACPNHSYALQTDTFTGKIDFNMFMDDGSVIPAGKVPVAEVDYGVRRREQITSGGTVVRPLDDMINQETIVIPYDGAGNFSSVPKVGTFTYGMTSNIPTGYDNRSFANLHSFYNLRFNNVPAYIRTISANSTVLGDHSRYSYNTNAYKKVVNDTNDNYPLLYPPPSNLAGNTNKAILNPNLVRTMPGTFNYTGSRLTFNEEEPNGVEFTLSGGSFWFPNPGFEWSNWHDRQVFNSSVAGSGKKITFFMKGFQVVENFEDETGTTITPPSGFTQGKTTDVVENQYTHTMGTLPNQYTVGSNEYVFEGWYQGSLKPVTLNTSNSPAPTIDYTQTKSIADFDDEGIITVVYKKKALHVLQEKYVDGSDASINSGSWDTSQSIVEGNSFTGAPLANRTDTGGADWEYIGWKEGISGTVNSKTTPVQINNILGQKEIYYIYKKKNHTITEKWVDQVDGSTLLNITGNQKTSPIDDNDHFTGTAIASITDNTSADWDFVGWENVTDAPGVINPAASYAVNNIKGDKEIRYHYQARNTSATLNLNPTPQITGSGGSVNWSSRLTNTGTSALNNLKLKATSNWASGLSAPTMVTVTPAGGIAQNFTVSPVDWVGGFNLTGISIPSGGANNYAEITFTDTATGAVNQVLPAEIEIDGNMVGSLAAENFVRIDDPDEPNLEPLGNAGLINIPDFRFGDVEVKPYAQTKDLDAASYQAGYNPYIRFKDQESLSGWSLTAKLGQFTSGSKTLPSTTSIELNNGSLKEVQNYNKHNESLSGGTSVGNKSIPSDSTTVALTNGATQGVYQLDYAFNDVELELLAHSGIAGLSYTADMDWTLTTAP